MQIILYFVSSQGKGVCYSYNEKTEDRDGLNEDAHETSQESEKGDSEYSQQQPVVDCVYRGEIAGILQLAASARHSRSDRYNLDADSASDGLLLSGEKAEREKRQMTYSDHYTLFTVSSGCRVAQCSGHNYNGVAGSSSIRISCCD
jgi:hypothetical protein